MIVPLGAPTFREALRWAHRGVPRARARCSRAAGSRPAVGDEGGFAPDLDIERGGAAGDLSRRSRRPATGRASRSRWRSTRRRASSIEDGAYVLERRGRPHASSAAEMVDYYAGLCDRYPIVSIEDGMAEDDWDGWARAHQAPRRARPARRRRPVRHQRRAARARHPRGIGELDPDQGEPDRHAHRDPERDRDGAPRRLHGGDLAPLGRDRGRHDRRPRGRHQRRPDQDRLAVAAPTAWRSTTSCFASRRSWARAPAIRARAAFAGAHG